MEISAAERQQLFTKYRYLCGRGARKFLRQGLERADLEQVAAIGLLKARDRYDGRASTPFPVYAWRLILGELSHHVRAHEHPIRPPRHLQALERRYATEWERLGGEFGREPTANDLAVALGTTHAVALELRELPLRRRAIVSTADEPSAVSLEDVLWLKDALARLPLLERRVVVGLYWCELPRAALGRKLGLRPSTILSLHHQAVLRLRSHHLGQ